MLPGFDLSNEGNGPESALKATGEPRAPTFSYLRVFTDKQGVSGLGLEI